jgi:photosystem II stability/assembly factor-like uncharacterized protein
VNSLSCPNTATCIGVGSTLSSTPYVIITNDDGAIWTSQTPPADEIDVTGISCSSLFDCVAVGYTGNNGAGSTIMSTTTGGTSWAQDVPPPGISMLTSASCPTVGDCFAAGVNTVLLTGGDAYSSAVYSSRIWSGLYS